MPSNADANGVIVTAHFEPDEHEHEFVEVKDTRIEPTCLEYGDVYKRQVPLLRAQR